MHRRAFFRGAGPSLAAAALAPIALFVPKPQLPAVMDDFQLNEGQFMTAEMLNHHIDVRAARVTAAYLAQLRRDGLV